MVLRAKFSNVNLDLDMIIKTRQFLAELWTFPSVVKNLSLVQIDQTC